MKRTFLETLYHCMDINGSTEIMQHRKYKGLKEQLDKNKFLESLSKEQKKLYCEYSDLENAMVGINEEVAFSIGFKLGLHAGIECSNPQELINECGSCPSILEEGEE